MNMVGIVKVFRITALLTNPENSIFLRKCGTIKENGAETFLKRDGSRQLKMTILTLEALMPEKHFLRDLDTTTILENGASYAIMILKVETVRGAPWNIKFAVKGCRETRHPSYIGSSYHRLLGFTQS